uniref:Photosystem I assembly protein Ycf4 n=1 Tax=Dasyclonium flaccidum TaxID=2007274 RepID=A0A1Z1MLD3_9FLOR|nr:photosystem I assembly protein [Dasyclonium flaccidum]ARW66605.1 photosystem I assembly protein [Dasyclonium flaccidum]
MDQIKIDKILGSRRLSNYWWATIVLLGSFSFFIVGLSAYLSITVIPFLPQGAIMIFYGISGILLSLFLWYTIIFDVGSGYNKFDNMQGVVTIFRLGFPGKNRILKLEYNIKQIYSIKIRIQEGLSSRREIYLKTKDKREIPLTKVGEPISVYEIEKQAKEIAKFLDVIIEGAES